MRKGNATNIEDGRELILLRQLQPESVAVERSGVSVSLVAGFTIHEHTIPRFRVPNVEATVRALRQEGVKFNAYSGFSQDELGILRLPGGVLQVAWFKDSDGNVLSVANA